MLKKDGIILNIDAVHTKNVKDPTGAGDSYMAGFIIGLSKFGNLKDVGHFASEIATRCIETKGALK